jgi:hypothetical protein
MTDLKQKVIENIRKEGFDMGYWGSFDEVSKGHIINGDCGTACCIAGHIVAAAAQLNLPIPVGGIYSYSKVQYAARALWADSYGGEEADRLEFDSEWGELEYVTPQDAIDHLNGMPAKHYLEDGSVERKAQ